MNLTFRFSLGSVKREIRLSYPVRGALLFSVEGDTVRQVVLRSDPR